MWENQLLGQDVVPVDEKIDVGSVKTSTALKKLVLIPVAINLAMIFVMFQMWTRFNKEDVRLSKKIRGILKDGKPWKVMIIKDKNPNAFAMVRPYVFITKGLMDMLTEGEIIAVLLHEAGHITNMDVWSDIISKNAFLAVLLSAVGTMAGPEALAALLLIYYYGGSHIISVIFARTLGRFKERRADSFAAKYGYADEMISALEKLEKWIKKMLAKQQCDKLCQLGRKIGEAMDEHPPVKDRIENILKAKETWKDTAKKSFSAMRNTFLKAFGVAAK